VKTASKFLTVDGISTHYLEAGDPRAPHIVLVHGGEFGACAELAYEATIGPLSADFHVIAPDLIGYGATDKIVEFGLSHANRHSRRLKHLKSLVGALGIRAADFVGNSIGGVMLTMDAASDQPLLPIRRLVSITGAGATAPAAREVLLGFDGTAASMRAVLGMLFHDERWCSDSYVERRLASALMPGAFEAASSARLRPVSAKSLSAGPTANDTPPYEKISLPVMIAVGAKEKCCPGWGPEAARRIPRGELKVFQHSAHCCQLEEPDEFNSALREFLCRP
jgi:pimeloyl-ACP methyl ester carboxylesterase